MALLTLKKPAPVFTPSPTGPVIMIPSPVFIAEHIAPSPKEHAASHAAILSKYNPQRYEDISKSNTDEYLIASQLPEMSDFIRTPLKDSKEFKNINKFFLELYRHIHMKNVFYTLFRECNGFLAGGMPAKMCHIRDDGPKKLWVFPHLLKKYLITKSKKPDFDFFFETEEDFKGALSFMFREAERTAHGLGKSSPPYRVFLKDAQGQYAATFGVICALDSRASGDTKTYAFDMQIIHPSIHRVFLDTRNAVANGVDTKTLSWNEPEDLNVSIEETLASFDFYNSMIAFNHKVVVKHKDTDGLNTNFQFKFNYLRKSNRSIGRMTKYHKYGLISCNGEQDKEMLRQLLTFLISAAKNAPEEKQMNLGGMTLLALLCEDPSYISLASAIASGKQNQTMNNPKEFLEWIVSDFGGLDYAFWDRGTSTSELKAKIKGILKRNPLLENLAEEW